MTLQSISKIKDSKFEIKVDSNDTLNKIKELHDEIGNKYKERGNDHFLNLIRNVVNLNSVNEDSTP